MWERGEDAVKGLTVRMVSRGKMEVMGPGCPLGYESGQQES